MRYELWEVTPFSCVGTYKTEGDALEDVKEAIKRNKPRPAPKMMLLWRDRGVPVTVAGGERLIERAKKHGQAVEERAVRAVLDEGDAADRYVSEPATSV